MPMATPEWLMGWIEQEICLQNALEIFLLQCSLDQYWSTFALSNSVATSFMELLITCNVTGIIDIYILFIFHWFKLK